MLEIVLRDSLHQPQYVEKLEKILRFIIKERTLTLDDLDAVWAAQAGKHEAIVKNVHDLLAKLAWDFSPEQLDHLFECFQVFIGLPLSPLSRRCCCTFQALYRYRYRPVGRLPIRNNARSFWSSFGGWPRTTRMA